MLSQRRCTTASLRPATWLCALALALCICRCVSTSDVAHQSAWASQGPGHLEKRGDQQVKGSAGQRNAKQWEGEMLHADGNVALQEWEEQRDGRHTLPGFSARQPGTSQEVGPTSLEMPGEGSQRASRRRLLQVTSTSAGGGHGEGEEGGKKEEEHARVQEVLRRLEQQVQETGKRTVIGITPTYPRAFQALYFNHLVAAIRSAGPPFLWLVIEGWKQADETASLLERTAGLCLPAGEPDCQTVTYIHLVTGRNETSRWNKAVVQRNAGLDFIQQHKLDGTVYFMDDDNTYSPLLFEEWRKVKRVGVVPVGFLFSVEYGVRNPYQQHHPTVERPLVRRREDPDHPAGALEIYGWETFEWSIPKKHGGAPRTFCTDMAGFAFNSQLLWTKLANIPTYPKHPVRFAPVTGGYLETIFLGKLVPGPVEIEPLADEERQVLVWHTHSEAEKFYRYPGAWKLPQPQDLVLITTEGTTWNYAVGGHRYGIRGRRDTDLRPGYKDTGVPGPTVQTP